MNALLIFLIWTAIGLVIAWIFGLFVSGTETVGYCTLCGRLVYCGDKYHTQTHSGGPVHLSCYEDDAQ